MILYLLNEIDEKSDGCVAGLYGVFEMGDSYTYTVQDIQETVFKPKDQTSPKEAFAYLDKLSH